MNSDLENGLHLKKYLLGDMSAEDQQCLEQRLLIDSAAFEELKCTEDELIDDYLEGTLSGNEREKFESFFLSAPERQQKLSFAKALKRYTAAHREKKKSWLIWENSWQAFWHPRNRILKWALAASLLFLIGGVSWSALQISRLQLALDHEQTGARKSQTQLKRMQSQYLELTASLELEQALSGRLKQEVANLQRAQKSGPSILPAQIKPALLSTEQRRLIQQGSDGIQEIEVPSGEGLVKLELKMEPLKYPQYQAALQRVGGDKIRTQTESSIQGQFSGLSISTELLTRGDYELRLSGITAAGEIEEIDDYYFRVMPQ